MLWPKFVNKMTIFYWNSVPCTNVKFKKWKKIRKNFICPPNMSVGSGGQGAMPPWIFKHGTDIVDKAK